MPIPDVFRHDLLSLPVYDSAALADGRQRALDMVTQSKLGRQLLQTAIDGDYAVYLLTEEEGAANPKYQGYTDTSNKRIFLQPEKDLQKFSLTLAHELAHAAQHLTNAVTLDLENDHPLTSLRKLTAVEADARAKEMLVAIELSCIRPGENAARVTWPEILDCAVTKSDNPMARPLINAVRKKLPDAITDDKILAAFFKTFYADGQHRENYENMILAHLEQKTPDSLQDQALYKGTTTGATMAAQLDAIGPAYLLKNAQHIDLDDPVFNSVSHKTQLRLGSLEKIRRQNPLTHGERDWQAEVYQRAKTQPIPKRSPQAGGPKP